MSRSHRRAVAIAIGIAAVGISGSARKALAVTYSWDPGTDGVINTPTNWTANWTNVAANSTADTANFGATGATTLTQNAFFFVQNINFNAGASAYTWNAGTNDIVINNSTTGRGSIT